MNETGQWIRRGQGEDGHTFCIPENYPHRVLFMGMMNDIPISSMEPKGGKAPFLQDAERNAAYFARFNQAQILHVHWCSIGKDLEL